MEGGPEGGRRGKNDSKPPRWEEAAVGGWETPSPLLAITGGRLRPRGQPTRRPNRRPGEAQQGCRGAQPPAGVARGGAP